MANTDMKNEKNYKEMVNPTFATGQATLEMLAACGNPDAITYKEALGVAGVTQRVGATPNDQNPLFTPEEGKALMMGVTLGVEARYAAVSRLIKESGCKSMLDIACGYTPRALMCQKEGVDYIGMDLPAVVDKMLPLSEKIFDKGTHPAYIAGDALQVALKGRLDTLSAPALMEGMDKCWEDKAFGQLIFDLEKLEYLSSTGLRVLLMMAERVGKENLMVDYANESIRKMFETTGFSKAVVIR